MLNFCVTLTKIFEGYPHGVIISSNSRQPGRSSETRRRVGNSRLFINMSCFRQLMPNMTRIFIQKLICCMWHIDSRIWKLGLRYA